MCKQRHKEINKSHLVNGYATNVNKTNDDAQHLLCVWLYKCREIKPSKLKAKGATRRKRLLNKMSNKTVTLGLIWVFIISSVISMAIESRGKFIYISNRK